MPRFPCEGQLPQETAMTLCQGLGVGRQLREWNQMGAARALPLPLPELPL